MGNGGPTMSNEAIREIVDATPRSSTRMSIIKGFIASPAPWTAASIPADDWTAIFHQYLSDDLDSAGMPAADAQRFFAADLGAEEKYRIVEPYWNRVKSTGYAHAVATLRGLYGEDDLTAASAPRIAEKYRALVRPGVRDVIRDRANIEECHVNSLERIFMETEEPDLLRQDLGFVEFAVQRTRYRAGRARDRPDDRLARGLARDRRPLFAEYGPRAGAEEPERLFAPSRLRFRPQQAGAAFDNGIVVAPPGPTAPPAQFPVPLFLGKATEYGLPGEAPRRLLCRARYDAAVAVVEERRRH